MADTYEQVTTESWGSRLRGSGRTVCFGAVFVMASIAVLIYNESNLVAERKALEESESLVQEVPSIATVDTSMENDLIHASGLATTTDTVQDNVFGISLTNTLKLKRSVEMYQWFRTTHVEKTKKTGGSVETKTTYTYSKKWVHYLVSSEQYKIGYENPTSMPFEYMVDVANPITFGGFTLPSKVLDKIQTYAALSTPLSLDTVPEATKSFSNVSFYENKGFYAGSGSAVNPMVGDVRVAFQQIPAQNISIVARQTGTSLDEYTTSNDREILLVKTGTYTAEAMFDGAHSSLTTMAWIIRFAASIVMWVALELMAEPLVVFADVLPILGNCVQGLAYIVSGLVAFCISLITIALAWLFFRPIFSLALFGTAAIIGVAISMLRRRRGTKDGYDEIKNEIVV